jgi:hypothetical protein
MVPGFGTPQWRAVAVSAVMTDYHNSVVIGQVVENDG